MRLLADLHVHSVASGHAYSTVTELASAAAENGLELIAVCDHGPAMIGASGPIHFWNFRSIPLRIGGTLVLGGCEANPRLDTESGLDLEDAVLERLDLVAVGMHPLHDVDADDGEANTAAILKAVANPLVDMITHPGNVESYGVDPEVVVAAAVEHGVILELNDHSFTPGGVRAPGMAWERRVAELACQAGAAIAINSDAHYHEHVGRFGRALEVAAELGIPEGLVVNRDAASVIAHLTARRDRPRLVAAGVD